MQRHHLNLTVGLLVAAMTMPALADNIDWQSDGSGDNPDQYQGKWEDTVHWSGGNVPGADDTARWVSNWSSDGPAATTIDADTLTALGVGAINVHQIYGNVGNMNASRYSTLIAVGSDGSPIQLNVGSTTDAPDSAIFSQNNLALNFSWVDLNIVGTPTEDAIWLRNRVPGATSWHSFTDTNVSITEAGADFGLRVDGTGSGVHGALLEMTRGSLTVTNATGNALITVQNGSQTHDTETHATAQLMLTDTLLDADNVGVANRARFDFDGTNAAAAGSIAGELALTEGGEARFTGGEISIGSLTFGLTRAANRSLLEVNGATVNIGSIDVGSGSNNATYTGEKHINVLSGTLNVAGNVRIGSGNFDIYGQDALHIAGGAVNIAGHLNVASTQRHPTRLGAGLVALVDGELNVNGNMNLGSKGPGDYHQTGGVATVNGAVQFYHGHDDGGSSNNNRRGVRQFVLEQNALLTLTGAGFNIQTGNTGWNPSLLTAANLNFGGTLKFSPDGVTQQNLIVFGSDIGADTAGYDADFAIGTLDVSDLAAAGALLNVLAAGNETTNAVYVRSLLLGDAGQLDPGSFFAGDANIYYDPTQSDITGTHAFTGGGTGSLIALPIPEPASALLLTGGALVMLRRRKSAV